MKVDTRRTLAPMKTITVAELRQNPTAALADVEAGEIYVVTRHRRPVAKLVPPDIDGPVRIVPARNPRPSNLSALPPRTLRPPRRWTS